MTGVTRTAPSPTGRLHLGHAYSALFAYEAAHASSDGAAKGKFLLRIEDIDAARCRPEFEQGIYADLAWLGLQWEQPVRRQSEHMKDYAAAVERLRGFGLVYPCFCTRAEIAQATSAPHGPDGPIYPGTCRDLTDSERRQRLETGAAYALRLDSAAAQARSGALTWHDRAKGTIAATPGLFGDVVIARKDTPTSYHLSVTLDDALQGVTLVTRGEDLFASTHVHRLLQALLGLPTPEYHHHPLVLGPDGKRLAKRANAPTLQSLRENGHSPTEVRQMALDALG